MSGAVREDGAFGELVRRYQTSVYNVCYRLLGERGEAEDLTQEAFLRAYLRLNSFDVERPFGPWMRRVAANLCLNHLRRSQLPQVPLNEEYEGSLQALERAPETAQERSEAAETLRTAILDLPPQYRAVIELRHFHDMSYAEISSMLEVPLSDVKSHLYRARKQLAARLREDG